MTDNKTVPGPEEAATIPASPQPGHESYGSEERDDVGGGPAGRGNDTGRAANEGASWGRGKNLTKDQAKPVSGDSGATKNPFSK